ncbi:MAG: metal ABC transporter substrate-binding protein [Filomicrobium sp.]
MAMVGQGEVSARRRRAFGLLVAVALVGAMFASGVAQAENKMRVVATFSILADMARNVGGERVEVVSLVRAGSDAHVFNPTPSDAVKVGRADVVIENGLGFEGWLARLVKASGYNGERVVASEGVKPLSFADGSHSRGHGHHKGHGHGKSHKHDSGHAHGEYDPHVWQDLDKARIYVKNIARGFCAADKPGCPTYKSNAAAYLKAMQVLDDAIAQKFASIPKAQRKMITSHDAFNYLGERYGIEIYAPEGLSTESEPSAKDIAGIIRQIRSDGIKALFIENVSDPRMIEQIARETGLKPAGRLYSDSLSVKGGNAETYLQLMRYNAGLIVEALRAGS